MTPDQFNCYCAEVMGYRLTNCIQTLVAVTGLL